MEGKFFDWTKWKEAEVAEITPKVNKVLKEYKEKVLKIEPQDLSFKNFIHVGEDMGADIGYLGGLLFPFVNLHPEKTIRDAALKVELEISKILNEFSYDEELYKQFESYYKGNFKVEKKKLTEEEVKIVEDANKGYKRMGMHLDKKTKKKVLEIKNKINKLAQDFDVLTVKNYEKGLWFKKEELNGVPEEFFKGFKYDEKKRKYFVNCSGRDDLGTDYPIVKKYCEVAKTREVITKYNEEGVGVKNIKKLAEIFKLRNEIVKILGYKTWADLAVEDEMMNKPKDIKKFLEDLLKKLTPGYVKYLKKVESTLEVKKEKLTTASFTYGEQLMKAQDLPVKEEEYKPYFELENVMKVLFNTWEQYFNIKTKVIEGKKVMHPDTTVLEFSDSKSGEFFGYGVLDLFPRPGKYGHACVADIFKKYVDVNGQEHPGFTFLVCNFKKSSDGKTFISLSDMNTLYHEAGHMLHMILMKNNYVSTGSTSRDFVEIPSQFHENFLLNEKFVSENFRHFETGEKMPKKLIENISKITSRGEARTWIRICTQSIFDQEVHSKNILKYAKNYKLIDAYFNSLWKKLVQVPCTKTQSFPSMWGHIVGGYDARYYSYVISKVYAQDFWNEFAKNGIKKGKMSEAYKKFLEGANTRKEQDLVKDYLKRKVSFAPFLKLVSGK